MPRLLTLLEKRSLIVTLGLAFLVILFLAPQVASENVMPFTDGNHYVQRAFALHGFLHTGQWGKFRDLLTLPRQTIAPLQYPLFFLLPHAWANLVTYGLIQLLVNFGLLAVASWNLCRVLNRPEWSPALFLLTGCENYSFDYPYFFFLDLTFCAFGALALSFQIDAWQKLTPRASLLSGLGLSLLFWIKPANALLYAFTFILSECLFLLWHLKIKSPRENLRAVLRHLAWLALGFLPLFLLASACGAIQTIFLLIEHNELGREWETHLAATGLLRLFYFPVCFAYFYNALVLLAIAAAVFIVRFCFVKNPPAVPADKKPFPTPLLLILVAAYAIYGEIFSFFVLVKTMRSLVVMLPVLWLFLFWCADRWRIRGDWLLLIAAAYVALLADQVATDFFGSPPPSPDKYLLNDAWYDYFPMAWSRYDSGPATLARVEALIRQQLPDGGHVGVSTERVFIDGRSVSLLLNQRALLDGRPPPYSAVRLFNTEGRYSPAAFLQARAILLYVSKNTQYSQFTWEESTRLLAYIPSHWAPAAAIVPLLNPRGDLLGYWIPLPAPLTQAQLADGMKACGSPGIMEDDRLDEYLYGARSTWPQYLDILHRWLKKRFGSVPASS
jgi:hypothetical protein